ncbi:DEAD/DEAH box helicase family protein [Mycoplasmopsis pulmonis]|uniref:DEAD/DEAH box helicase family protein n=1 Tax=Mycoplasmopsis pulmonis TaxID=2107 RepID=UPI0010051EE1|nr:DEAD/DEAH box helicase family protein [Mycoplasmopsis pulmonis]VEU68158.1 Type III restriction enzyme, res subunit [Mycoplasmopsis pulmonis]
MILTKVQEKIVSEIVEEFKINEKNIIQFQAPTRSGKTFMMANVIDRIISRYPEENFVFIIATLSSADLPTQMKNNLESYKQYLSNDFEITIKESPSKSKLITKDKDYNFYAEKNKVFILGKSSFGKDRIFTERWVIQDFLIDAKERNFKIIYIRDEAHYGSQVTSLKGREKNFESQVQDKVDFVLKMTATPTGSEKLIYITEEDLKKDNIQLLKDKEEFNSGIDDLDEIDFKEILEIATNKFVDIQKQYLQTEGLENIRPAMLIQVSDKYKDKEEDFEKNIDQITTFLDKKNLTWIKYFSNEKISSNSRVNFSLNEISENFSDVDVIIFKVGPAVGWNIPRATMLVKLRSVCSDSLNIQTLGRIKRNPNPNFEHNEQSIARKYFLYSDLKIDNKFIEKFRIKEPFKHLKFFTGKLVLDENPLIKEKSSQNYTFWEKIKKEILKKDTFKNTIKNDISKFLNKYQDSNIKHNDKNKFLICESKFIKDEKNTNVELIINKAYNKIDLRLFILRELKKLKNIFNSEIKNKIDMFIKKNFKDYISIDFFWYVLLKKHKEDFISIYQSLEEKISKKLKNHQIYKNKNLPEFYSQIVFDDDDNKTQLEHYAYEKIIRKNKTQDEEKNQIYFDSEKETIFINELKKIIKISKPNFAIWSKNILHEGLGFEYIRDGKVHTSYPDFIIMYKDQVFYIEVKDGKHDIDEKKTKSIINAYKNYIENYKKTVSVYEKNFSLLVCYVHEKQMIIKGSSTNDKINDILVKNSKVEIYDIFN